MTDHAGYGLGSGYTRSKLGAIPVSVARCLRLLGVLLMLGAATPAAVTVGIGSGLTNIGDAVEIPVDLSYTADIPAVLIFFIAYDPVKVEPVDDFYEMVQRGLDGEPLRDGEGNVITITTAVRSEQAVTDAGKVIDTEIHAEGVIGIAIAGANTTPIPNGQILTVAFRVRPFAVEGDILDLDGVGEDDPVILGGESVCSTASSAAAQDLPVVLNDGEITLGCQAAGTAGNVSASQDRPDGVLVTWTAVADAGAEYRVYRSTGTDANAATPLGEQWQTATSFLDITAEAPAILDLGGCFQAPEYQFVRYNYWVKARTAQGCEGAYSTPPAEGFRGAVKSLESAARTQATVFPKARKTGGCQLAAPGSQLAARLSAAEPIDPASIWAECGADGFDSAVLAWVPAGPGDGWVTCSPALPWRTGETVTLTIGAMTAGGVPAGPVTCAFHIEANRAKGDRGAGGIEVANGDVPVLALGAGSVYRIGPEGVFVEPLCVWLPVPVGARAAALQPYYFQGAGGDARWYPASHVEGWLVSSPKIRESKGKTYIELLVRHSGFVQLGYARDQVPQAAAVSPPGFTAGTKGNLLILGLLGGCLAATRGRIASKAKPVSGQ